MVTQQGDVALLQDPVAQELLRSATPARLAYTVRDGSPRVVPIWFHWNGTEIVMGSPAGSPKARAISRNPAVALTIDGIVWPYKVLQVRGMAKVEMVAGVVPEYAMAAERYFGPEAGQAWIAQIRGMFTEMARITITPQWVGVIDFEQRFPNVIEAAMAGSA